MQGAGGCWQPGSPVGDGEIEFLPRVGSTDKGKQPLAFSSRRRFFSSSSEIQDVAMPLLDRCGTFVASVRIDARHRRRLRGLELRIDGEDRGAGLAGRRRCREGQG